MGGPQDTRLRTELGGKDFKVFHQRGGELGFHDFLQGLEKQGFGLGHAPADDDGFRVQEIAAIHQGAGEFYGQVPPYLFSHFITRQCGPFQSDGVAVHNGLVNAVAGVKRALSSPPSPVLLRP